MPTTNASNIDFPIPGLSRRSFVTKSSLGLLGLMASRGLAANPAAQEIVYRDFPKHLKLAPTLAEPGRIIKETVGLRPFRTEGPNMSVEALGNKRLVHHYGHGGSGWSLSWGTADEAVTKATETGAQSYAVIGCGVIGMTTATVLQRAGKQVTIYTKDRQPNVTSSMATGVWSPDSRICLESSGTPKFEKWWADSATQSFRSFQDCIGLPNKPVEWVHSFSLSDIPWEERKAKREAEAAKEGPRFAHFDRLPTVPGTWNVTEGTSPFAEKFVKQGTRMIYNIPIYTAMLMEEFYRAGGKLKIQSFDSPDELKALPERVIVNCTGLGSQQLFGDDKLVPVRGQLTFLVPQSEVRYNVNVDGGYTICRQDGIVIGSSNNGRYGSTDLTPDRQQSLDAIAAIARTMSRMKV